VRIEAPGGFVTEDETCERTWHTLFSEMTTAAFRAASRRRFPTAGPPLVAGNGAGRFDQFFDTLSFLLKPGDEAHNAAMIRDFVAMSGIPESFIREKLAQAMLREGAHQ
jgi:hypothetical protein